MDLNPFFHPPNPSNPSSQSLSFVPRLVYHPSPAVYPGHQGVALHHGGYNVFGGPQEHQFFLLNLANQMSTGQPAATGVAMAADNNGSRCRWHSGAGLPCNEDCADFDNLIIHLGRMHDVQGSAERKLPCKWLTESGVCGGEYRRQAFRRHIGTHLGHSVPCPECGKSYSRGDSMRAHAKKVHGKQ